MAFSWGAALTQFGKDLPTVGLAVDDIFEKKRQAKKDELKAKLDLAELEKSGLVIGDLKDALAKREEGRAARKEYLGAMDRYSQLEKEKMPVPQPKEGIPLTAREQGALNTNELIERQKPDVENYGLDYYSAYDEGIKNMLTKEGKLGKLGIGASVYQMKKEDIDRIRKMPEGPAKEAAWEDFLLNAATSTAYGLSDEGIGKSVEKARKTQLAQIPGKTKEAEATTLARGGAEAKTPQFVAERKKEWERTLGDYNEAYQQYSLGRNAPDNATGDVAIVNALEKVREINSAVMYGDYEKWQKANNLVSALEQDGILGAFRRGAEKRLPPQARKDMQKLLDELFANRQTLIENARKTNIDISKRDYDWDDRRANDVFRAPKLGFQSGYTPDKATAPGTVKKTFNSVQEAEAANLPKGTVIYINGRRAVVE